MQYSDMAKSIEIFMKHIDDDFFEADHDIIYGPNLDTPFTDEEKKKLEDMGWIETDEYDCWSHFC